MSSQVEDALPVNLEQYFSNLTLQPIIHGPNAPPMPHYKVRGTLTPLTLSPAGYRKLREMYRFDLSKKVVKYFSKLEAVQKDAFRNLQSMLERDPSCEGDNDFSPYLITSVSNLENLLYRLFFRIQEVLDSLDETMRDWSFETFHDLRNDSVDTQPLDPILYCLPGPSVSKPSSVKLVILPVCPWEFTPRDFVEFSTIGRFDDTNSTEWQSRSWVNADKMWAHLYDLCLYYQCPLFVVTSYEQWIFGIFSKHYTNAWFSPILSFDNKPVSVIEMLTFWIHASFAKEDTFAAPNIYSERQLTDARLEAEVQTHVKRYMEVVSSRTGPDLHDEDMPPAKRRRLNSSLDDESSNAVAKSRPVKYERHRRPPALWKELRALEQKRRDNESLELEKTERVVPVAASAAPSSSEPLPEALIPRSRNAWCQRWRDMVAMGEDNVNTKQSNGVTLQVYDPTTGHETGDFVQVEDYTCPSCCNSSPTLSACSLTEEEIERWRPRPVEDFDNYPVYQWN